MTTKRNSFLRLLSAVVLFFVLGAGTATATIIEVEFGFAGGFDVSLNGGALTPSGPLTFTGLVDNTTPDLNASIGRGDFEMISVVLDAPDLGFVSDALVLPNPILLRWYSGGMALVDLPDILDIGWNGGPTPPGDRDDLSNLAVGTFISPTFSTFFLNSVTLASGNTLFASIGAGGVDGTFAVRAVPEPGTLGLLGAGLLGLALMRRRRDA